MLPSRPLFAALLFLFALLPALAAGETRIAVMNYQAVLFNSAAAEDATLALRSKLTAEQARLQDIEQQIKVRQRRLSTDRDILTADEIQAFEQEVQQLLSENAQLSALLQQEQQQSRNAFVEQFQPVIRELVAEYVAANGITLVLDAQMVLWNDGEEDITRLILDQFDSRYVEQKSADVLTQ